MRALLAWRNDLVLLTPQRINQREPLPDAPARAGNRFRQAIETVNSQLAGQFRGARIQAKLTAHTIGVCLNCPLGRPLLALKDLAVI